jgi:hypothetical protein
MPEDEYQSPKSSCYFCFCFCYQCAEVQFFAATTLHTKLVKAWHQVPPEQYASLKKQLLEAIASYCIGPKIVLNRLCIAVSIVN